MKLNQLSFGVVLEATATTSLVLVVNHTTYLPVPAGFTVLIAPDLAELKIRQLKDGRVKFPGDISEFVVVTTDKDFRQVRIVRANGENAKEAGEAIEALANKTWGDAVNKVITAIANAKEGTNMAKIATFFGDSKVTTTVQLALNVLSAKYKATGLDFKALFSEVKDVLVDKVDLPKAADKQPDTEV